MPGAGARADLSGIAVRDRDRLKTSLAGAFVKGSTEATGTEGGLKAGLRMRGRTTAFFTASALQSPPFDKASC